MCSCNDKRTAPTRRTTTATEGAAAPTETATTGGGLFSGIIPDEYNTISTFKVDSGSIIFIALAVVLATAGVLVLKRTLK